MPESTRQREAFDLYWKLGGRRSIPALHERMTELGDTPNQRTLFEWSRLYHWQDRLADLEREARRQADEAKRREIEEMYDRQAKEGLLLQQKGAEWLTELAGGDVSGEAAIRAVVEGARLERLAKGEPGERVHQEGEVFHDLGSFSIEELRRLAELAERGATGASQAESE